jgi:hypothetical protein
MFHLLLTSSDKTFPCLTWQVSYLIVDEMHHDHPELLRDQYWDEVFPAELPYTVASEQYRDEIPEASTANIEVHPDDAMISSSVPRNDEVSQELSVY